MFQKAIEGGINIINIVNDPLTSIPINIREARARHSVHLKSGCLPYLDNGRMTHPQLLRMLIISIHYVHNGVVSDSGLVIIFSGIDHVMV